MRRELRRRGIPSLKVVYSTEPPLVPADDDMAVKDGTRPAPRLSCLRPLRSRPHSRRGSGEGLGGLLKRAAACSSGAGYSETVGRWRDESTGDGSGAGSGDGSGAHGAGSGMGKITLAPRLSVAYNSALREMVGVA